MKRFLSLLLTVAMVFSCMSITALADDAVTFELFGSTNIATSTYAHAGSKVMIETNLADAETTYYKNGVPVDAPEDGLVAGTKLFDVTAGSNIFTAEVGGVEVGRVAIYGIQLVRAAASSDLGATVDGNFGGTKIEEGAPIDGTPHPFAYKIENEYSSTFAGTNVGFDGWIRSMNSASRNHVSLSYGFYIDGTLTSDFYVLDIRSATKAKATSTPTSQSNNYGTLSVKVDTNNQLVVANKSDVVETGIILESGRWYNLSMGANYVKNGIANVYIDGILVAKVTFLPNNATGTSGPAIMKASGGGGNGYIGNATATVTALDFPGYTNSTHTTSSYMFADRNQKIATPTAPSIALVTGEANTVTVTEPTLPAELTGYETKVFVNGEVAETVPNGDNLVIQSKVAYPEATVYAAIVDTNDNVVTSTNGALLKSADTPMEIVANVSDEGGEGGEGDDEDEEIYFDTFELKYEHTKSTTSTYAHAGSKVMATAVAGADYYKNGEPITLDYGLASGTVALPITAGVNHFTAVAGGTTYGPISVYGLSFAYQDYVIGAELSSASYFNLTAAAAPVGGRTAYIVGSGTGVHQFTSDMNGATRYHIGHGYAFYMAAAPTEKFVIMNLKNADNTVNFELFVEAGKTDLKFKDWTGETFDTGYDITPGEWYELNTDKVIINGGMLNVYLNRQLVARAHIINPESAMPDTLYTNAPTGDGTNTYVGDLNSVNDILTSARRNENSGVCIQKSNYANKNACRFYVQRNGDYVNRPSMTAEASDGAVTVTEVEMSEFTAYTNRAVYVNGRPAADLGITATNEGNVFTFVSTATYPSAEVTVYVTDADGNFVNGMYGPLKATVEVDIVGTAPTIGNLTTYGISGAGFAEQNSALAGEKVIFNVPTTDNVDLTTADIKYFNNGTEVTASASPYENTVALSVAEGNNSYTAKVVDKATGNVLAETAAAVTLYGAKLSEGSTTNIFTYKSGSFTNVTDTLTADLESTDAAAKAKAEALLADGRTVYQTKATAGGGTSEIRSYLTEEGKAWSGAINEAYKDVLEVSFDFYLDKAFSDGTAIFSLFGTNTEGSSLLGTTGTNRNAGYYFVRPTTMGLYLGDTDNHSGIIIECDRWYNVKYYLDTTTGRLDYYLDGVLVAKANKLGVINEQDLNKYVAIPLVAYSTNNSTGYFANATINTSRHFENPAREDIYLAKNDGENTVTVTAVNMAAGNSAYLFVDGVKQGEALTFADGVATVDVGNVDGAIYAAILDAEGNVAKNYYGETLQTREATFTYTFADLKEGVVTLDRSGLAGGDKTADLAIVTTYKDKAPTVDVITSDVNEYAVPTGAVKVFVWVWSNLKPLVDNLIK